MFLPLCMCVFVYVTVYLCVCAYLCVLVYVCECVLGVLLGNDPKVFSTS